MKKELTKKVLTIIPFFLILALVLALLSYLFMPSKSEKREIRDVIPNGLLAEEDNTIDVLFKPTPHFPPCRCGTKKVFRLLFVPPRLSIFL